MLLRIQVSETDDEMLELFSVNKNGHKTLWGVVHSDFSYEDHDIQQALKSEGEIEVEVTLKK